MAYKILEVGPGDSPLGETFLGHYNWPNFPNSDYTAVQPTPAAWQRFPKDLIDLPNVTYIEKPIQSAGLKSDSFDEVYARNILSDPSVIKQRPEILSHIGRVLRAGGLLTVLDTYTPEYALSANDLIDYFRESDDLEFTEKASAKLLPLGGQYLEVPSAEWLATAGQYCYVIRHNGARQSPSYTDRFCQIVKQ